MKDKYWKTKKSTLFFSWLLSYISILFVPIMIGIFAYFESVKIIEEEVNKAHMASLEQSQQIMDGILQNVEKLSVEIAFNKKIQMLTYLDEPLTTYNRYIISSFIQKDLKTFKLANRFIDDFFIYFKNNNFVLSYRGMYNASEYYDFYYDIGEITYDKWEKTMQRIYSKEFIKIKRLTDNGDLINSIAYIQSLPVEQPELSKATIVILMDNNTLNTAIQSMKWVKQGKAFIINKNNSILISNSNLSSNLIIRYEDLNKKQDVFNFHENDEDMVISYITSDVADWKYVSILPRRVFLEKAKYFRKIILITVLICFLVGGCIAYLFTKRNYNPMKKTIEILADKVGISFNKTSNEYRFIQKSILKVIEEKERFYERLENQKEMLKNNFLIRLIKGNVDNNVSIQDACDNYDIKFYTDDFAVILFYIEDYSNLFFENNVKNDESLFKMVHFIIKNVVEELINKKDTGYIVEIDEMIVCLINLRYTERQKFNKVFYEIADNAQKFIEEKFGIYFSVSISNVHSTVAGIPQAYNESVKAIEYKMIMGSGQLVLYDDIVKLSNNNSKLHYSLEDEYKFINAIKTGDYNSAINILNDIVNNIFCKHSLPVHMVKCRMFRLVNTLIYAMEEININCGEQLHEQLYSIDEVLKCKSIVELKEQMKYILKRTEEYFDSNSKKQYEQFKDDILVYVKNNYNDLNMSVAMVADYFKVNPSYLSAYFKKRMGMGLLEYIHKTRIMHAKKFLDDTDMSIKKIAEKVGYYNSVAFIRSFKKYEGITPGKYRNK